MSEPKPLTILLAEDDPDDRYLISEALDESQVLARLYFVADGEELLDYLYHRGQYADTSAWPPPDLILLDLNMPLKDGREALGEIKANPELRQIPVVVLTTSRTREDIRKTYSLGSSGYISKPDSFGELINIMQEIGRYWHEVVALPPEEE